MRFKQLAVKCRQAIELCGTAFRNGPPVQILSEPEDVMTIDSTLLVLGVNDTTCLGCNFGCLTSRVYHFCSTDI